MASEAQELPETEEDIKDRLFAEHMANLARPEETFEQVEFESIAITIDHLVRDPAPGETAIQTVWSTKPAFDALLNQVDYFVSKGESVNPFTSKENLLSCAAAATRTGSVFIYTPSPRLTNVLMDRDTFGEFLNNFGGSVYGAISAIVALALSQDLAYAKRDIDTPLLVCIDPDGVAKKA